MSNSNLLQGYSWDTQFDDAQPQFPRQLQDEVISVYEVYVKEETVSGDGRGDISMVRSEPGSSGQPLQSGECVDLEAAIGSDIINVDGTITKFIGKESTKYKIIDGNIGDENVVVYNHPLREGAATSCLVDKDDPRSRLHFVKYLKRDGKTLKIWECGICSKEFRHQYTLMRHLPTHTDERNFKCEACGKAFRQLSTLSQHRAIHSDARPYVCEFCKKTFNRVSTLISHRKTHSEHKPHKCHLCGKGFHQKGNLRNHVFTHTNERPYKCELCGKGFNQMSNLMCHKVKAHAHAEKLQYVCGICGKEFPRRFSLKSHEEFKHGIKYRNANTPNVLQEKNDGNVDTPRNKSVSIVSLPNRDRGLLSDSADKENLISAAYPGNLIIDKIDTKAMENALLEGHTPFALLKPAKGIPVLVKVSQTANHRQMLTPATADDLRMAGDMSLSPALTNVDDVKAIQVKVPVVATITQRIDLDGNSSFLIEPPGSGQEHEGLIEAIESQSLPCLDRADFRNDQLDRQAPTSSVEDCGDLLELAAQGGIQFVRATEDGRYEVMTSSEARDLMAQNSHDVTILDGEDAEAISMANIRQIENHAKSVIEDPIDRIPELNFPHSQKLPTIEGMEILRDEDIRIIDEKNLEEDHFAGGITVLDQNKIDEYILASKSLSMEDNVGILEEVDANIASMESAAKIRRSILDGHEVSSSTIRNMQKNFTKTFDDGMSTILCDDVEFASSSKSTDVHPNLSQFINSEVKILGSKNYKLKVRPNSTKNKFDVDESLFPNDSVKILSSSAKIHQDYLPPRQHRDYNLLNSYGPEFSTTNSKREVKILGKKKESNTTNTDDSFVQSNPSTSRNFEVSKSTAEELDSKDLPPDSETYLSLMRINGWLRNSS